MVHGFDAPQSDGPAPADADGRGISRRAFALAAAGVGSAATLTALGWVGAEPVGAATGDIDGLVHDEGGQVFDVRGPAYGARGDTTMSTGGSVQASGTAFSTSTAVFVATDVGKVITVQGAGQAATVLSTTIAAVGDATQVTLATPAGTTVSGADFAFGTDDTVAIVAAIAAAGGAGTVYIPPGVYLIQGASNFDTPIDLPGCGGLLGAGGGSLESASAAASVLLCADATAGVVMTGAASYEGFLCHGNHIATAPLQNGNIVSGVATDSGSSATFIDVWATASAGTGWQIFGCQGNSYLSCGSTNNAIDGLYVDGGAGGLGFWHWTTVSNGRYGVHAAAAVPGGTGTLGDHSEAVRFYSGSAGSAADNGVSVIYLRGTVDWKFLDMTIRGDHLSGPTVDLDQSAGYAMDFRKCRLAAATTGASPGLACIQVGGSPPVDADGRIFLGTDLVRFMAGDTSVYFIGSGSYTYSAVDWVCDYTEHGPASALGLPAPDTLLFGRTGAWQPAALSSPWSGAASYRINELRIVQLSGNVSSSTGVSGPIFTLPAGYRPGDDARQFPATLTSGFASVTVGVDGVVTASATGTSELQLDSINFPLD